MPRRPLLAAALGLHFGAAVAAGAPALGADATSGRRGSGGGGAGSDGGVGRWARAVAVGEALTEAASQQLPLAWSTSLASTVARGATTTTMAPTVGASLTTSSTTKRTTTMPVASVRVLSVDEEMETEVFNETDDSDAATSATTSSAAKATSTASVTMSAIGSTTTGTTSEVSETTSTTTETVSSTISITTTPASATTARSGFPELNGTSDSTSTLGMEKATTTATTTSTAIESIQTSEPEATTTAARSTSTATESVQTTEFEAASTSTLAPSTASTNTTSQFEVGNSAPIPGSVDLQVSDTDWFLSGDPAVSRLLADGLAAAFGVGTDLVKITGIYPVARRRRRRRLRGDEADGVSLDDPFVVDALFEVAVQEAMRRLKSGAIRIEFELSIAATSDGSGDASDLTTLPSVPQSVVVSELQQALEDGGLQVQVLCAQEASWHSANSEQACGKPTETIVLGASSGEANEPSGSFVVQSFIDQHLVPYGVASAGLLVALIFLCCCWFQARRRRRRKDQMDKDGGDPDPCADELDPPLFGGRKELPPAEERPASASSSSGLHGAPKEVQQGALDQTQGQGTPSGSSCGDLRAAVSLHSPAKLAAVAGKSDGGGGALLSGAEDFDNRPVDDATLDSPPEALQVSPAALARWVRKVYTRYNPKKLYLVDDLLEDYKGRERELVDLITHKYRLHPSHFEHHYSRSAGGASCGACGNGDAGGDVAGGCDVGHSSIFLSCVVPDVDGGRMRQRPQFALPPPVEVLGRQPTVPSPTG
mmetsp:Transcript_42190/g.106248  ORF Transcript_42190/g.106248 Transcript_42190/m.106248 type:complete len:768 (+) Transcript_42190:84-2387(+)